MAGMTISDIATTTLAAITVLGLLTGAAWWMSALYAKTKSICVALGQIRDQLTAISAGQQTENQKLWEAIRKLERDLLLRFGGAGGS